jgi:segregation and condensation protein B
VATTAGSDPGAVQSDMGQRVLAVLFTSGGPVPAEQLALYLDEPVQGDAMSRWADAANRVLEGTPLTVRCVAGGLQLVLGGPAAAWLLKVSGRRQPERMSPAAWECLAVVAYRQPVTRLEVEALRGVNSDHALDTLLTRGLIAEAGRREVPGRPIVYATTDRFLEVFGLESLEGLPPAPDESESRHREGGDRTGP